MPPNRLPSPPPSPVAQGRFLSLCQAPDPVGWTQEHGHPVATRAFLVVTAHRRGVHGEVQHDGVSADPVSEAW